MIDDDGSKFTPIVRVNVHMRMFLEEYEPFPKLKNEIPSVRRASVTPLRNSRKRRFLYFITMTNFCALTNLMKDFTFVTKTHSVFKFEIEALKNDYFRNHVFHLYTYHVPSEFYRLGSQQQDI
uniref:Uncharacterized protein n=1 Tax=Glossina austeni TaxID=7395 RepID=A0A1A9UKT3_GLOAU